MSENHNQDQSDAAREPSVRFAFQTDHGVEDVDAADLPEEARRMFIESLRSGDMPDVLRTALSNALGLDLDNLPETTETTAAGPDAATSPDDPDKAPQDGHAPGCNCADQHREHVWRILDAAFPQEPHLWKAMEALFELSAVNPHEINDAARRTALNEAALHIKRHTDLTAPPLSPTEQLVEQFRKDLGMA